VSERWSRIALPEPPAAAANVPERVAAQVRELIAAGELAAGERLPSERDLAAIFGVSRLSIREAFRLLDAAGLVDVRHGAGTFVARRQAAPAEATAAPRVGGASLDELFEIRLLLEPAAAEWAARRRDEAAVGTLRRLVERFETAVGAADWGLAVEHDVQLHVAIAEAADNTLLAAFVRSLNDGHRLHLEWSLRRPRRIFEAAAEYRRLVDAIASRDGAAARTAMLEHLRAAAAAAHLLAGGEPDPVD
jgi:GntR family transcriptional regulator, transcriptional repressor for pyruvate dehydrogenase complex